MIKQVSFGFKIPLQKKKKQLLLPKKNGVILFEKFFFQNELISISRKKFVHLNEILTHKIQCITSMKLADTLSVSFSEMASTWHCRRWLQLFNFCKMTSSTISNICHNSDKVFVKILIDISLNFIKIDLEFHVLFTSPRNLKFF